MKSCRKPRNRAQSSEVEEGATPEKTSGVADTNAVQESTDATPEKAVRSNAGELCVPLLVGVKSACLYCDKAYSANQMLWQVWRCYFTSKYYQFTHA